MSLRKLFYVVVTMVVLIGAAAAVVFNVPAVQDAVFKRTATAVLAQTPELLDGMRVILTRDLHTFDLPAGSSEIRIREP